MKKLVLLLLCMCLVLLTVTDTAWAATEQAKQAAIDKGLAYLAATQSTNVGGEGWWPLSNDGTLAATASAALAFVEEGFLPGDDVIIDTGSGDVHYGDVVGKAVLYIFNRAALDARFGPEVAGYPRYAEDYNNDGNYTNDGGNNEALFFDPSSLSRNVYTTGICAPIVFSLGQALGKDTVVGMGSAAISAKTYAQAMQDVIDWFSWGQVEPDRGIYRGGWRYDANYSSSDNSTAQWGSLPMLYATVWGLKVPQYVKNELELWVNYVQNPVSGGSGYTGPNDMVNPSKTGGLLLELASIGAGIGDPRVQLALSYINTNWNTYASSTWYGNLNHPYGMWAIYKALEVYGFTMMYGPGADEGFLIGQGIANAPGGFTIGQDWWATPVLSTPGDWYSHYNEYLVSIQLADGSWTGYSYWYGALAAGWYINILNAAGSPPPQGIPYATIDPELLKNYVAYSKLLLHMQKNIGILSGDIGSNDALNFKLFGQLKQNIRALGDVGVMYNSVVEGNVVAGGAILQTSDSIINGFAAPFVPGLVPYEFSVDAFAHGDQKVIGYPGDSIVLPPGSYADLKLSGAEVTLSTGTYFLKRLSASKGSKINFDLSQGPVVVCIVDNLLMYDSDMEIVSPTGNPSQILFNVRGGDPVNPLLNVQIVNAAFLGTLIAPDSEVWVNPADVIGAVYGGKKVVVANGSTMIFAPFGQPFNGGGSPKPIAAKDEENAQEAPVAFSLSQNYPNPFNPQTTIAYTIPDGASEHVSLCIYDLRGALVRKLVDSTAMPGSYSAVWDGRDESGAMVSSGVYLYRLAQGMFVDSRKMILVR